MSRKARLQPLFIALPIVVLCLSLGVWQLQRLRWKEGLIAQREAALKTPPSALPYSLAAARELDLHRVLADGVFLNDKEILLHAIAPEGDAGFDVLTPLREADGHVIFVDRGFVPTGLADREKRAAGEPTGAVKVVGRVRLPPAGKPGWFLPDNRPAERQWFWVDLPAMAKADALPDVAPFFLAADAKPNPGGWPRGGVSLPELPNNHLQYALTWFALALAAAVIFFMAQRKGGGKTGPENSSPTR